MLQRIYQARGICDVRELDRSLSALLPVEQLAGASEAATLLAEAVTSGKNILIVGDFDCDGATSCALAVLALRAMGCTHVDYLVPNRFEYGYGLTPEIVALALDKHPDVIVTVDNGISSIAGVEAANKEKIPVIVTDHHLPGAQLPDAAAIVNPNLADNSFPGKATAGVGVIFYVLAAVRARLRKQGWFEQQGIVVPNLADYLDLVALGTVADVVPLDSNNRILVYQGLNRIRAGKCRPGITALLEIAGRNPQKAVASDMGFAVGPRLNAAGRLDDMSVGIECLLTDSMAQARKYAVELDGLNRERRNIEEDMRQQAMLILDAIQLQADGDMPWGLCLYDRDWHQGVIGILASRIKERFNRPVIAFADAGNGEVKGSARSIKGLHIRDVLDEVASKNPGLIQKFGGHAMAAGLSLSSDDLPGFMQSFDAIVRKHLSEDDLQSTIHSDGEISADQFNLETARMIADAGPWGQAFPEPLFDGFFNVLNQRVLKDKHWKLILQPMNSGLAVDAIGFGLVEANPHPLPDTMRVVYRLDENEFRGNTSLQLRVEYMQRM